MLDSEPDWLIARRLYPQQRAIYRNQMAISALRGDGIFGLTETGHPVSFARFLLDMYARSRKNPPPESDEVDIDAVNQYFTSTKG